MTTRFPSRRELGVDDRAAGHAEDSDRLAGERVPDTRGAVVADREDTRAVGAELARAATSPGVADERRRPAASRGADQTLAVPSAPAGHEVLAVAAERARCARRSRSPRARGRGSTCTDLPVRGAPHARVVRGRDGDHSSPVRAQRRRCRPGLCTAIAEDGAQRLAAAARPRRGRSRRALVVTSSRPSRLHASAGRCRSPAHAPRKAHAVAGARVPQAAPARRRRS